MGVDMMPDGTAYVLIGGGRTWSGDNLDDVDQTNYLHNWAYHQTKDKQSQGLHFGTRNRAKDEAWS